LGIDPKECKSIYNQDPCTSMFIIALFTAANLWNQPKCPKTMNGFLKMWYIYIHNGVFVNPKEE
jgi:hypothetical protein